MRIVADLKYVPESCECLEVDGFQHMLRSVQFQQQHDENAMVRKLLKLALPNIMVLQKYSHHNAKNLTRSRHFSGDSKNHFARWPRPNTLTISKKIHQQILTRSTGFTYWKHSID